MKSSFSKQWKSSVQPRKQRKYRENAPLHIKGKFVRSHLSKELAKKHDTKTLRIRKGDKVKVVRGGFKNLISQVERVDLKNSKIYLTKAEISRTDGTKRHVAVDPSNVIITEIKDDKRRFKEAKNG